MEGTDVDGPFCSRRSSGRPTTEFWHHTIAFRSLPNIPLKDQGAASGGAAAGRSSGRVRARSAAGSSALVRFGGQVQQRGT